MLTLSLFRHAKSSWDDATLDDFDRPLSRRGEKAAPKMGRYIEQNSLTPELVLCSTAKRTRQTIDLAFVELTYKPEIRYEEALYHASIGELLDIVRNIPPSYTRVMLVGHNPGFQSLTLSLINTASSSNFVQKIGKFPTAAVAIIRFDLGDWQSIDRQMGHLYHFMTPKNL